MTVGPTARVWPSDARGIQHATTRIWLFGAGLPVTTTVSGQSAGGVTATTSSEMFGFGWLPAAIAPPWRTWQGSLRLNAKSGTGFSEPANEPMSVVCSEPFATEPPPTESVASFDAVTAPRASWLVPTA